MGGFLSELFGSKPNVPQIPNLSLPAMQAQATQANLANLPADQNLVNKTNQFGIGQINQMLNSAIPGYSEMASQQSSDLSSMLAGEIPSDVSKAIQESSAAGALSGGYGGSGMAKDLVARDLGLTSMNLMEQGMQTADKWIGEMASIESPQMMNVGSMFITPEQQYQATNEQDNQQFQRNWMQAQVNATPDPQATGLMDMIQSGLGGMRG